MHASIALFYLVKINSKVSDPSVFWTFSLSTYEHIKYSVTWKSINLRTFLSWKMFQMVVNFYGGRIIEFFIRIRHFLYELLKVILLLYIHNIGIAPRKRWIANLTIFLEQKYKTSFKYFWFEAKFYYCCSVRKKT